MSAYIDPNTRDFVLTSSDDWQALENPVAQSMYLCLATQRGTCFWDLESGSTLHLLTRETMGSKIEADAEARALEALQPMVDAGEIQSVQVSASKAAQHRLELRLSARDSGQRPITFTTFVRV